MVQGIERKQQGTREYNDNPPEQEEQQQGDREHNHKSLTNQQGNITEGGDGVGGEVAASIASRYRGDAIRRDSTTEAQPDQLKLISAPEH